jgi:hemimethylated DNA binding protein
MYPPDKAADYSTQPNYSVLVDTRDREDGHTTYVPQENLEHFRVEVNNPLLVKVFEGGRPRQHQGGWNTYTARQALNTKYPDG